MRAVRIVDGRCMIELCVCVLVLNIINVNGKEL